MKKVLSFMFALCIVFSVVGNCCLTAFAETDVETQTSIVTTLKNNITIKTSKKTFDVFARDKNGKKVKSSVTLNGENVPCAWDDADKTSFTLEFSKEGKNNIEVSAGDAMVQYSITYVKAKNGEVVGQVAVSVELFSFGSHYLIEPTKIDVVEGENAAIALVKLLHKNGFLCYYSGDINKNFYMAYISDGDKTDKNYNGYKSSVNDYDKPSNPKKIEVTSNVPPIIAEHLENDMTYFDKDDYKNMDGFLGEFLFSNGSGWMYAVNNVFPNVSFSQSYLAEGDVMRVQFTLGYGADIGGFSAMGGSVPGADGVSGDYYKVSDKDRLTWFMAEANTKNMLDSADVKSAYDECKKVAEELDVNQSVVDSATKNLEDKIIAYNAVNSDDIEDKIKSFFTLDGSDNNKQTKSMFEIKSSIKPKKSTQKSKKQNKNDSLTKSFEDETLFEKELTNNSAENTTAKVSQPTKTEKSKVNPKTVLNNNRNSKNPLNSNSNNSETLAVVIMAGAIIAAIIVMVLLILLLIYILKKKGIIKNDK